MEIPDRKFNKWKKELEGKPRWIYHGEAGNMDFDDSTKELKILDKRTKIEYTISEPHSIKHEQKMIDILRRDDKEVFLVALIDKISTKKQKELIKQAIGATIVVKKTENDDIAESDKQ